MNTALAQGTQTVDHTLNDFAIHFAMGSVIPMMVSVLIAAHFAFILDSQGPLGCYVLACGGLAVLAHGYMRLRRYPETNIRLLKELEAIERRELGREKLPGGEVGNDPVERLERLVFEFRKKLYQAEAEKAELKRELLEARLVTPMPSRSGDPGWNGQRQPIHSWSRSDSEQE